MNLQKRTTDNTSLIPIFSRTGRWVCIFPAPNGYSFCLSSPPDPYTLSTTTFYCYHLLTTSSQILGLENKENTSAAQLINKQSEVGVMARGVNSGWTWDERPGQNTAPSEKVHHGSSTGTASEKTSGQLWLLRFEGNEVSALRAGKRSTERQPHHTDLRTGFQYEVCWEGSWRVTVIM